MLTVKNLYDLEHTQAKPLLEQVNYPWEALAGIGDFILELGKTLSDAEYDRSAENVWIAKSAKVAPRAIIANILLTFLIISTRFGRGLRPSCSGPQV